MHECRDSLWFVVVGAGGIHLGKDLSQVITGQFLDGSHQAGEELGGLRTDVLLGGTAQITEYGLGFLSSLGTDLFRGSVFKLQGGAAGHGCQRTTFYVIEISIN